MNKTVMVNKNTYKYATTVINPRRCRWLVILPNVLPLVGYQPNALSLVIC